MSRCEGMGQAQQWGVRGALGTAAGCGVWGVCTCMYTITHLRMPAMYCHHGSRYHRHRPNRTLPPGAARELVRWPARAWSDDNTGAGEGVGGTGMGGSMEWDYEA